MRYEIELKKIINDIQIDIEYSDMDNENKISHINGLIKDLNRLKRRLIKGTVK